MIGVDVLPDESDFANAGVGKLRHLVHDFFGGPRNLRAARVGHHAKCAEFVAALLHGDERGDAARARRGGTRRRKVVELVVSGKFGIDHFAVAPGAHNQVRQAVVILRSDDEVDSRRPADDFLALGLGNAAGDGDEQVSAVRGRRFLHEAYTAKFRIDFLGRLLADVAGVEDDDVGILRRRRFDVALRRQGVRHTLRVVDVHLAAERFYVQLARTCHSGRIAPFSVRW